jgi:cytochrome c-type biogenesis protein CcmH
MITFFHKKKFLTWSILAAVCLAGFFYRAAQAQQAVPTPSDDEINAVAKQLYCPVCENISLDVCPTTACAQWRDLIKQKLEANWTTQQIKDYFVKQYGDRVLAEPPRHGINWLVYVVPPVAILLGVYIFIRVLRSMRMKSPAPAVTPPDVPSPQDEYLKRVEQELSQRK